MSNPESISDFLYSEESPADESEDFPDKSWHGIQCILTDDVWEGSLGRQWARVIYRAPVA